MQFSSPRAHARRSTPIEGRGAAPPTATARALALAMAVVMTAAAVVLSAAGPVQASAPAPVSPSVAAAAPTSDATQLELGNYFLQLTLRMEVGAGVNVRVSSGPSNCMGPLPSIFLRTSEAVTTIPLAMTVRNDSFACVLEPSLQQVNIDVTGGSSEVHNNLNFVQLPSVGLPNWQVICGSTRDCSISRLVPTVLIWESTITAQPPPPPPTPLGIDCAVTPARALSVYHQPCVATGGTSTVPTTLSIVSGRLPAGLELVAPGVQTFPGIAGYPSEKGSFPIRLRASNGVQADAVLDVTVVVEPSTTYTTVEVQGPSPFHSCAPDQATGPTCGATFTVRTYSLENRLDASPVLSVRGFGALVGADRYALTVEPPVTTLLDDGVSELTTVMGMSAMSAGAYEAVGSYPGGPSTGASASQPLAFEWVTASGLLALPPTDPAAGPTGTSPAATPVSATPALTG